MQKMTGTVRERLKVIAKVMERLGNYKKDINEPLQEARHEPIRNLLRASS
jgi:hypothetical protein